MAFLAGEDITAGRLNRLQNATYNAAASGTVAASQTNADVPGCTITFTTVAANAVAHCWWVADFDNTGAQTGTGTSRLLLDSVTASSNIVEWAGEVSTDRTTTPQMAQYTIAATGSHTIKMQATTLSNMTIGLQSTLRIMVVEVV